MTAAEGRLTPLAPEEWDASLAGVLAGLGDPLNIHGVIARNPAPMRSYIGLRGHVVAGGSLSPRQRELVILRVARLTGCACEWGHHVARGRAAGFDDREVARIRDGSGGWPADEALLIQAVDDMLSGWRISPGTWSALCAAFDDNRLLDAFFTVGVYVTLSAILNTAGVPREDGFAAEGPA